MTGPTPRSLARLITATAIATLAMAACSVERSTPGTNDDEEPGQPLAIGLGWDDSRLVTFDPVAGSVQQVHLQMGRDRFVGMTYDPNRQRLYAVSLPVDDLYAIDLATMTSSHLGPVLVGNETWETASVHALAYDTTRDVLYGAVVRADVRGDPRIWRTDLVRIDVATAAVATIGTIPDLFVAAMDSNSRDGQLYGIATGVDGKSRVVRIDPDDATSEELLVAPYETMLGFARRPGTNKYVSWINDETGHFYGETNLDTGAVTLLGKADEVGVIGAFVFRRFEAAVVPVPRPKIPVSFRFTGHVDWVRPDGRVGDSIAPGDAITGRIAYDVNAPYRRAPTETGWSGFSVKIGDATFAIDTHEARVGNDELDERHGTLSDSIDLASRHMTPNAPVPANLQEIYWHQIDATARALKNNDTLPKSHDLSTWDRTTININVAGDEGYYISAVVDTIVSE